MIVFAIDASETGAITVVDEDGKLSACAPCPIKYAPDGKVTLDGAPFRLMICKLHDCFDRVHVRAIFESSRGNIVSRAAHKIFDSLGIAASNADWRWRATWGVETDAAAIAKARLIAPTTEFSGPHGPAKARTLLLARLIWRQPPAKPGRPAKQLIEPNPSVPMDGLAVTDDRTLALT
jgi:hypothetical protein